MKDIIFSFQFAYVRLPFFFSISKRESIPVTVIKIWSYWLFRISGSPILSLNGMLMCTEEIEKLMVLYEDEKKKKLHPKNSCLSLKTS